MADRVVAVVRHREAILCCRPADGDADLALPGTSLEGEDADGALESLLDDLGLDVETVERRGHHGEMAVALVSVETRHVDSGPHCATPVWERPSALQEQGSTAMWRTYRAVAPTVETVASDTERGSTAIAVDALWALRDAAIDATAQGDLESIAAMARELLAARPAMAVLANRVNRVMAGARSAEAVEQAATEGIRDIEAATRAAAGLAARTIGEGRVLTLSRSGTVRLALMDGRPAVEILASLPGGEGVAVAETLDAAGLDVSVVPDAAVYARLRSGEIDAVLVGADAVTPVGAVVNKVGTRAAALAAADAGVPFYVVCASAKIRPGNGPNGTELPLEPLFDLTPAPLVTAVLTERGDLTATGIAAIAEEHRALTRWQTADAA